MRARHGGCPVLVEEVAMEALEEEGLPMLVGEFLFQGGGWNQ